MILKWEHLLQTFLKEVQSFPSEKSIYINFSAFKENFSKIKDQDSNPQECLYAIIQLTMQRDGMNPIAPLLHIYSTCKIPKTAWRKFMKQVRELKSKHYGKALWKNIEKSFKELYNNPLAALNFKKAMFLWDKI